MATEQEIRSILIESTLVDISRLKQVSRLKGGFLNAGIRQRVWPKLLGVNRYDVKDFRAHIVPHRDENQVLNDIDRSLWSLNPTTSWSPALRHRRREALFNIIMAVLCKNESLYYYQGFHDVVSIFLLVLEDDYLTFALVEELCVKYLPDFMQKDFSIIVQMMGLIMVIIKREDPELSSFFEETCLQPYFATSWLITWFTHDIKDVDTIARLLDALLCSHPLYGLYVCTAYVLHFKNEILECECDFATVHSFLTRMPKTHGVPVEDIIKYADQIFGRTSPSLLKSLASSELKDVISQNMVHSFLPFDDELSITADWLLLKNLHITPVEVVSAGFVSEGWEKYFTSSVTNLFSPSKIRNRIDAKVTTVKKRIPYIESLKRAFDSPVIADVNKTPRSPQTGKKEVDSGDEIVVSVYTIAVFGGTIGMVSMALGIFLSSFVTKFYSVSKE